MAKGIAQFWNKMKRKNRPPRTPLSTAHIWLFILLGCATLGVVLFGWSAYLFVAISAENLFTPTNGEGDAVLTIDRSELSDALEFVEVRESRFEMLHATPPDVTDPGR